MSRQTKLTLEAMLVEDFLIIDFLFFSTDTSLSPDVERMLEFLTGAYNLDHDVDMVNDH